MLLTISFLNNKKKSFGTTLVVARDRINKSIHSNPLLKTIFISSYLIMLAAVVSSCSYILTSLLVSGIRGRTCIEMS